MNNLNLHENSAQRFCDKILSEVGYRELSDFFLKTKTHQYYKKLYSPNEAMLFSIQDFDEILQNASLKPEDIEFFKEGQWLDSKQFFSLKSHESAFRIAELDKNSILDLLNAGYSIRLNEIQRYSSTLRDMLSQLSKHTISRLSLNCYFTLKNNSCLKPHSDEQSLFIIQMSGKKNWYLGDAASDNFLSHEPTLILSAGDLLFVPKGLRHAATCDDQHSLHLTLAFTDRSVNDYLQHVIAESSLKNVLNQKISDNSSERKNQLQVLLNSFINELGEQENLENYLRTQPFAKMRKSIADFFSL
jgi:hypothetical protein